MEIYIIVVFTAVGKPMLLKPAGVNNTIPQNTFSKTLTLTVMKILFCLSACPKKLF